MGLLRNLFSPLVSWWRMVWYTPERDMPPLPPETPTEPLSSVSVINMPSAPVPKPVVEPPRSKRVVEFRGVAWHEESETATLVRFSREIAVAGRAVKSELTVAKADLVRRADGRYTLNGRD